MQTKQTSIAIIVMLTIAFGISLTGWIRARNELIDYKNVGIVKVSDGRGQDLSVCDDIKTATDEQNCRNRLIELANLLTRYESNIKGRGL